MNSPTELVTVERLAFGGDGVAHRADGKVVFVPFTAPGDTVRVKIVQEHPRYARAVVDTVETAAPERIEPVCPHVGVCGGCQYQHITRTAELAAKQQQFTDALERLAHLPCAEAIAGTTIQTVGDPFGYRNKLTVHIERTDGGEDRNRGFYALDNSTVVTVTACPLADPRLQPLLDAVHAGEIRPERPVPVTLRVDTAGHTAAFFGSGRNDRRGLEETLAGATFNVPVPAFWQVNVAVADAMLKTAETWCAEAAPQWLLDVYAGAGPFAALLGRRTPNILCAEIDDRALRAARENCGRIAPRAACTVSRGLAEHVLPRALKSLTAPQRRRAMVVLDPPRGGCHPTVLRALADLPVAHVLYVSCNAATLARDFKELCRRAPYTLTRAAVFDMFPRTAHFESMVLLES